MGNLTVVMYHYVRETGADRYPGIKARSVREFKDQLDYLMKFYHFVTVEECIHAMHEDSNAIPNNSVLLTFDDGCVDHFYNVFPLLNDRGIQGCFFPPARAIERHSVLAVNKIQFLLSVVQDIEVIKRYILCRLDEYRECHDIQSNEFYYNKYAVPSRFDGREVNFVKRMLQVGLSEELRDIILDDLFRKYVTSDEAAFSRELYMSIDQLRCLKAAGMFIGGHGYEHYWLGTVEREKQQDEIKRCMRFLERLGCDLDAWVMCYPYGSYNESLLEILATCNCRLGFTTVVDVVDTGSADPLTLPRLDTNDLPCDGNALPRLWTKKILS